MFPTVKPLAPWEATALLSNAALAAGLENVAKLDRLTFLEALVANLLLGRPATLGLAALPAVKAVAANAWTTGAKSAGPEHHEHRAARGDFTGAHFVAWTWGDDGDTNAHSRPAAVTTRSAAEMLDEIPHVVPGDAWLVLVTNASDRPLVLTVACAPADHRASHDIPDGAAWLFLVTVVSLNAITFTPLLAGTTMPAMPAVAAV